MVPPEFVDAVISDRLLEAVRMRRQNEGRKAKEAAATKRPSI
jgi:hypothetical protein